MNHAIASQRPMFTLSNMGNTLKTLALLGLLSGLMLAAGSAFGQGGLEVALVICVAMNLGSWWFSDKLVLAMTHAQEVSPEQAPELHRLVEECALSAGIPKPRVFMLPGAAPNAFATGRNPAHGVVCVTTSITQLLDRDELRGVIAHEMSHIKNRDTLTMAVAGTLAATIMFAANTLKWSMLFGGSSRRRDGEGLLGMLATVLLAPLAAMLIQSAISRSREYEADATGAHLVHSGFGLASALEKISGAHQALPGGFQPPPAFAHLFIVNPLSARGIASLFSTHPPAQERIDRLRRMIVS